MGLRSDCFALDHKSFYYIVRNSALHADMKLSWPLSISLLIHCFHISILCVPCGHQIFGKNIHYSKKNLRQLAPHTTVRTFEIPVPAEVQIYDDMISTLVQSLISDN